MKVSNHQQSKPKSKKFVYVKGVTKKHEVLKEAMKYLDEISHSHPANKYEFVCSCINHVVNGSAYTFHDKSGLIQVIRQRLLGYGTFSDYLRFKHGISYDLQAKKDGRKLQYTRLCWMQSMYEEFKAKDE